ncbi:hypothetical protein ALC53_13721 [Atta colombica]|uniref:Uncharacterized protein n=1 Tax=Atta colombica TaxID=520822 RepID=A0A195ATU9_9HYME|nr:hypothetical protein ALC53_13721 [Atta colombica]
MLHAFRRSDSNPEEESQSETPQVVNANVSANLAQAKLFSRELRNRAFPCCCVVRRAAPISDEKGISPSPPHHEIWERRWSEWRWSFFYI